MIFGKGNISKDYEGRCGNCHTLFDDDEDEYCRYCGTKRGEGDFLPYENFNACVYGPPPEERVHICGECGFSWTTIRMLDRSAYCPKCGSRLKQ
ncbi:MAG: hypothetical protein IKO61_06940 [Lachnospiraceae bacterium]|nr:hypothetical protein [Lachnospiraceae bacterium]